MEIMKKILLEPDFTNPQNTLQVLTSLEVDYDDLTNFANQLVEKIPELHTNPDGRKFQAITQGILECIKLIKGFNSTQWVSHTKLTHELKSGQNPTSFIRINNKQEECSYKIINFDQIDFTKEIEYADEYEVITKQKPKPKEEEDETFIKILSLLKNGDNVFLTGFAGTGKSYILNKLKEKFKKKLTITSTTGIAAVNVKGQTLHSWAGVGLCRNPIHKTVEKIRGRVSTLRQILNCKILAIDEISMLNIEVFEYVNAVLKEIRENPEPFGGIQVLFIGDFFQLPPVEAEPETSVRKYCFDSPLWEELNLKNVVLKKNYRQNEEEFITALAHMRTNALEPRDIELLNTRNTDMDTSETNILHIFSTNNEANQYNLAKFNRIEEPVRILEAQDAVYRESKPVYEGFTESENYILEIFSKNCRAEKEIALKLGAKVMLLVNMDFNKGLINGACGTIMGFNENSITIKFDNGIEANIPKHKFEYFYNDRVVAERTQYPLRLAYGITIHKSQGMTLDKLVVDCSRIFERGQAYVAMSRVKTLEGLYLKGFEPQKVMVDSHVAEFYENIEEVQDIEVCKFEEEKEDEENSITDSEARELILGCVNEFSGSYGKSGFVKILTGSRAVKDSEYNSKIASSKYFASLKGRTQKSIGKIIDNLVEEKQLSIKRISFGRPVLCKL